MFQGAIRASGGRPVRTAAQSATTAESATNSPEAASAPLDSEAPTVKTVSQKLQKIFNKMCQCVTFQIVQQRFLGRPARPGVSSSRVAKYPVPPCTCVCKTLSGAAATVSKAFSASNVSLLLQYRLTLRPRTCFLFSWPRTTSYFVSNGQQ